jgi:hypothetical protein
MTATGARNSSFSRQTWHAKAAREVALPLCLEMLISRCVPSPDLHRNVCVLWLSSLPTDLTHQAKGERPNGPESSLGMCMHPAGEECIATYQYCGSKVILGFCFCADPETRRRSFKLFSSSRGTLALPSRGSRQTTQGTSQTKQS